MKRFARTALLLAATMAISVGPVLASDCAGNVYGWYYGQRVVGHLIGTKTVTLSAELKFYFGATGTEQFCVGTYQMTGENSRTFRIQLRCDTYSVWGMF